MRFFTVSTHPHALTLGVNARVRALGFPLLTLRGEGGRDLGCPNVLTFPVSIKQPASIATMKGGNFIIKMTSKVTAYNYPLLARFNVSDTTKLLQIAPIPSFLVYDDFKKDLNAVEVIKRVLAMDRDIGGQDMNLHIQKFLLSYLSCHNSNNTNPYVHSEITMQTTSTDAKKGKESIQ